MKNVVFGSLYKIPSRNGVNRPSKVRGEGYKMINMGELFANDRIFDIEMELVPLNEKEKSNFNVLKNDLLFARQSIVAEGAGKCSIVLEVGKETTCFESHIIRVRLDETKAYSLFYYYFFQSEVGKGYLSSIRQHGVQAGIRGSELSLLKLPKFSLPTQQKIASILSAYDDLIENNLKRIKLLEEKAQQTYQQWFSVDGLPNGWRKYKLGQLVEYHIGGGWGQEYEQEDFTDLAYVIRGTDMDKLPKGSLEKVPLRWHKKTNLKSRKLKHGDIVFEVSGGSSNEGVAKTLLITNGLLSQFDEEIMCASFCKLIRPKSTDLSYALILFFKYLRKSKATEIFEKRSASNIVNYNWEAFLKYQEVKIPEINLLNEFNSIVRPLLDCVYNLGKHNTRLKEARDILLPRLMTGMIDVDTLHIPPVLNEGVQ